MAQKQTMAPITIEEGTRYLLSHFHDDNALWPRWSSVKGYWPCKDRKKNNRNEPDYSVKDILFRFYEADLQDCRLSPYPDFTENYMKSDISEALLNGETGIRIELILIDLDKGLFTDKLHQFESEQLAIQKALFFVLDRINEKFHGKFNPTVLWTGNGYHIYLPVQLSGPSWCLGATDTFMKLSKTPDRDFLRWAELYLSDGLCDPKHCESTSFLNMWLRVPGSINSKNGQQVRILQRWDGNRPYINWILKDFYDYLVNKSKRPKSKSRKKRHHYTNNTNNSNNTRSWKWEHSTKW
jgi:hypothetical protein